MSRPSPAQVFSETARLAHGYRWSLDEVLDLEHGDRRRFLTLLDGIERS